VLVISHGKVIISEGGEANMKVEHREMDGATTLNPVAPNISDYKENNWPSTGCDKQESFCDR